MDYLHKFVYLTDQLNPIALAWDGLSGYITGEDRFGNALSGTESGVKLVSAIPIAEAEMLVANALSKVTARIGSSFATKSITKAGGNVAAREIPTVTEQALEISNRIRKNSINIRTPNKTLHFDLQGATHKGVSTPHIQQSLPNINPKTGQIFWNKDRQWVRPMTQQDIRIIQNYLKRK